MTHRMQVSCNLWPKGQREGCTICCEGTGLEGCHLDLSASLQESL